MQVAVWPQWGSVCAGDSTCHCVVKNGVICCVKSRSCCVTSVFQIPAVKSSSLCMPSEGGWTSFSLHCGGDLFSFLPAMREGYVRGRVFPPPLCVFVFLNEPMSPCPGLSACPPSPFPGSVAQRRPLKGSPGASSKSHDCRDLHYMKLSTFQRV